MSRTRRLRGDRTETPIGKFTEDKPCVSNDFADPFVIDRNCTETPTAAPTSPGDDAGPSLVYRCGSYRYCSEEPPLPSHRDSDAPSPWELSGTCDGSACPPVYREGGTYAMDDAVAVPTPALVYECDDAARCNSSPPPPPGEPDAGTGWGLVGGCGRGDGCPAAHDPGGVYAVGDRVAAGPAASEDSSAAAGWEDGAPPDLAYTYSCSRPRLCNGAAPYESSRAWDLTGACVPSSPAGEDGCPEEYRWHAWYGRGESVSVSVGELNSDLVESLSCPAGSGGEGAAAAEVVTYAYEVESRLASDPEVFLPRLEESILLNLADNMLGCLGEGDGRRLESAAAAFGPRGIDSAPDDVALLEAPCTFSSPGADSCFVVSGSLTLHLADGDESSAERSRVLLRRAMNQDELLSPKIPEVVRVRYLADSIGGATSDQPLAAAGAAGGAAPGIGAELSPVLLNCIAGVIGVLVAALLTMIFVKLRSSRRRRRAAGGGAADSDLAGGEGGEVTLHVSNIAPETPDGFLREVFEQHGAVHDYSARTDDDDTLDLKRLAREEDGSLNEPFGPESSRQALVTMDREGARSASEYADGLECDGYVLRVREADDVDRLAFRDAQAANGGGVDPRERCLMDGCSLMSGSYMNDPRRFGLGGTMSAIEEGDEETDGGGGDDAAVRGGGGDRPPTPSGRRTPGMLVGGALAGAWGVRSLVGKSRRKRERNELAEIGADVSSHGGGGSRDPEADLDRFVEAMSRHGPAEAAAEEADGGDGVARTAAEAAGGGDVDDARSYLAKQCVEFTDYDFSRPGQQHSTNHVPCCKSGTCIICRSPGTGVVFVKAEG